MNKPIHPNFFIPETFGDAVSYEVQVKYLHQRLKALEEEGIPTPDLTELKQRVTTLETEVSAIQGEIEHLDLESITAQFEQINTDIDQLQATQSQQGATIQGYNTRLLELETKTDSQDQAIDALDGRVTGVTTTVANVVAEQTQMAQDIAGKQDQLTAGANITIENNVISASGGGGTIDIDTTVTANSQHAVTSEGIYNAIQSAKTAVETQHTTDIDRIDGELAGKASTTSVTTLRGDMEDEIERVEGDYKKKDTDLDTRLTAVETAQTTTEGNVTTLQQNVTTLQQTQTSQGTAIQGIRGRLDTAESNITQLQTNTSTLSGDVSSLQQTVSGKQDQLTAGSNITIENNVISASGGGGQVTLDDTVTETSSNGVKSSGIYTAIETAKSGLQESITDIDGRVDTLEADNTTNKSDITTLQSSVASAQEDIGSLQTKLTQEASDRETADQALRVSINANASDIKTLRTNTNASITQLQTDVAGKQNKLTAGSNITIENNVISASGGGGGGGGQLAPAGDFTEMYSAKSNQTAAISAHDAIGSFGSNVVEAYSPSDLDPTVMILPGSNGELIEAFVKLNWMMPNVFAFGDWGNNSFNPMEWKNGSSSTVSTAFNMFASNPYFVCSQFGGVALGKVPSAVLQDVKCHNIPISCRTNTINDDAFDPDPAYTSINACQRIMKGYAVYQKRTDSPYGVACRGVMWVEPDYGTVVFHEESDLMTVDMHCKQWVMNGDFSGIPKDAPIAIIPIY